MGNGPHLYSNAALLCGAALRYLKCDTQGPSARLPVHRVSSRPRRAPRPGFALWIQAQFRRNGPAKSLEN